MTGIKVHTRKNTEEVKFEKIKADALKKKQRMRGQLHIDARHVVRELEASILESVSLRQQREELVELIRTFKVEKFNNIDQTQIEKLKTLFRALRVQAEKEGTPLTIKSTPYYRNMTAHAYRIALLNAEIKSDVYIRTLSLWNTFRGVFGLNKRWIDYPMTTAMFIALPISLLVVFTKYFIDLSQSAMVLEVESRENFEECVEAIEENKK